MSYKVLGSDILRTQHVLIFFLQNSDCSQTCITKNWQTRRTKVRSILPQKHIKFLAMTIKNDQSKGRIILLPYLLSCKVKMFGARWIRNCLWAGTFLLHLKITSPKGVIECKLVFLLQITNWSLGAQIHLSNFCQSLYLHVQLITKAKQTFKNGN